MRGRSRRASPGRGGGVGVVASPGGAERGVRGGFFCVGSPRVVVVGGNKAGGPAGSQGCGGCLGAGAEVGVSMEQKSHRGGFRGKRGEAQLRGSPSGSSGRWRCASGLGGGLKAPRRATDAPEGPDHALPGAGGAALWGPPAPWPAAQRSPRQRLGPSLPPPQARALGAGEKRSIPEDGTLQAPDLLLRLLREAALPGMPMHGLGSASALADRGGETEGERKTGGEGSFARRKPLLGCSEGGRCGPRCCPPPLPGCITTGDELQ